MKSKILLVSVLLIVFTLPSLIWAGGEPSNIGIGFRTGLNRIEGDLRNPTFNPFIYGHIKYNLFDYLAITAEGGYSVAGAKTDDRVPKEFQTIIMPYELHLTFSFLPLGKINPYVVLGGGGFYWNYTIDGKTPLYPGTQKYKRGYDSFFKSGGGVEILLNREHNLYLNVGATFRYSLTDVLDDVYSGDENDGLIDIYGGLTYYFRTSTRGDRDHDGVPDELDLKPEIKEDPDGYMDHDGKPDGIPPVTYNMESEENEGDETDEEPPVVIHYPIRRVEEGKDIVIKADIYENRSLKIASILYRPIGFDRWKVGKLRNISGSLYEGVIPSRYVRRQGLEYCVIAVDEAVSGVGYCGLPKLPVRVEVIAHPKMWRIISGTAALFGWGGSGYLILRKQR